MFAPRDRRKSNNNHRESRLHWTRCGLSGGPLFREGSDLVRQAANLRGSIAEDSIRGMLDIEYRTSIIQQSTLKARRWLVPFISTLCSAKYGGLFIDKGIHAFAEITCHRASNEGIAFGFQLVF